MGKLAVSGLSDRRNRPSLPIHRFLKDYFTPEMLVIIKDAAKNSVIPKWADRAGGFGSESVDLYNSKVGPITGLYVQPDGTAGTTPQ